MERRFLDKIFKYSKPRGKMFESTLSGAAQATLALLGKSGLVKDGYLAGGSALALHFGHRYSQDFDFFSQKNFDPRLFSQNLKKTGILKKLRFEIVLPAYTHLISYCNCSSCKPE